MTLSVQVFDSPGALGAHADDWNRAVAEAGSDIYFTAPWLETWQAHYANQRPMRLLLMRDAAGDPVAALPFVVTAHPFPASARLATWAGAQETIPVFRPAIRPGHERAALTAALEALEDEADGLSLTPLSGEDGPAAALARAARGLAGDGAAALMRDDSRTVHAVFTLPDDFEAYIDSLGKNQRQNYRRYFRKLAKTFAVEETVATGADAGPAFERFVALHTEQWQAAGLPGHFGDWPGSEAFNRELVARFSAGPDAPGGVGFHEIRADGDLIASRFFFTHGQSAFLRLPARKATPEFEKLRLGQIAFFRTVEPLVGQGIRRLEAGPGHYGYKLDQGAVEHPLRRLVLALPGRAGAVRRLLAWADAVDLAYYRAFRLKAAPRLGLAGRPLIRPWIRTRL